jgi:hypothetical protein
MSETVGVCEQWSTVVLVEPVEEVGYGANFGGAVVDGALVLASIIHGLKAGDRRGIGRVAESVVCRRAQLRIATIRNIPK